jgi:hypothetical protein
LPHASHSTNSNRESGSSAPQKSQAAAIPSLCCPALVGRLHGSLTFGQTCVGRNPGLIRPAGVLLLTQLKMRDDYPACNRNRKSDVKLVRSCALQSNSLVRPAIIPHTVTSDTYARLRASQQHKA